MTKHSIALLLEQAEEDETPYDYPRSKFFGSPVFPRSFIEKEVNFDWVFIAQINLEDVDYYDTDRLLPHKGYLYFFYDEDKKDIHVMYTAKEITDVVENYNRRFDKKAFEKPYYMTFETKEEVIVDSEIRFSSQDGTKLLGFEYDNIKKGLIDEDEVMLLQIDPLCAIDFPFISGNNIGYIFIKAEDLKKKNFKNTKFIISKGV